MPLREDDQEPVTPELVASLVAFDEALRTGDWSRLESTAHPSSSEPTGEPSGEPPAKLDESQLARARECLLELQSLLPGSGHRSRPPGFSRSPERIGRFEIVRVLGVGGFAIVYLARDHLLNRQVALKVPRWHSLSSESLRDRFVQEARATGRLDHPHIAPTYEAGSDGDLPYLAIAYCSGPTLAAWIKERDEPMPPKLAARVVADLAAAVQYSHDQGVLHRDIKPGNILLFPTPGSADEEGKFPFIPRLTDFGLAKVLEGDADYTTSSMVLGTPLYMAPEQALGRHTEVGPASDVYGLGGVLYCLLTGRPPFRAGGVVDTLRQVTEWDPIAPMFLQPGIDRDLSVICLKCLEKQPASRYATARELAEDLGRYAAGEPVRARPTSVAGRCRRWCRRKPLLAGLLAGVLGLAASLIATLLWHSYTSAVFQREILQSNQQLGRTVDQLHQSLRYANQQKQLATTNEERVAHLLYASDLQLAAAAIHKRDLRDARELLSRHREGPRGFAWRYLWNQVHPPSQLIGQVEQKIWFVTVSPTGRLLAVAGSRSRVDLFDVAANDQRVRTFDTGQVEVNCVAFSPDERLLATTGDDGRLVLWEVETGRRVHRIPVIEDGRLFGVAFLNEGKNVIVCGRSPELTIWDVASGELVKRWNSPHPRTIESLAVSPDGQRFASAGAEGKAAVFLVGAEEPELMLTGNEFGHNVSVLAFSPDGDSIVTGSRGGLLRQFDARTGMLRREMQRPDHITAIAVSSGSTLACGDAGGVVSLLPWDEDESPATTFPQPWVPLRSWAATAGRVGDLVYAPHDDRLVSGDDQGQVVRWSDSQAWETISQPREAPLQAETLLAGDRPREVFATTRDGFRHWSIAEDRSTEVLARGSEVVAACRTSSVLALGDMHGRYALGRPSGEPLVWRESDFLKGRPIKSIGLYSDGGRIALLDMDGTLVILESDSGALVKRLPDATSFAISPDERWIVVARSPADALAVIDLEHFQEMATCPPHATAISSVRFTSDGQLLLAASHDRTAVVWDSTSWKPKHMLHGHLGRILATAISPDDATIATGDDTGVIKLWSVASGQELLELPTQPGTIMSLVFTADQQQLCALVDASELAVFNAPWK